jgi:hypothetical protein
MGSITAGYASGKEVVATQSDREYACSDPENIGRNTLEKTSWVVESRFCKGRTFSGRAAFCLIQKETKVNTTKP